MSIEKRLRDAEANYNKAREELNQAVWEARDNDWTWTQIGKAFGVSRQAVWERFHKAVKRISTW